MIREMLSLILKENMFGFADRYFKKLKGVAMGTPVAPTLANLFMEKVEAGALSSWTGTQTLIWLRFIDDIVVIMESNVKEMNELVSHCNGRMSAIQYSSGLEDKDLPFKPKVVRSKPTSLRELITRATSSGVRSVYNLRSDGRTTTSGPSEHPPPP